MSELRRRSIVTAILGVLVLMNPASERLARSADDDDTGDVEETLEVYDRRIDDGDRSHWSYLPVMRPHVPEVSDRDWPRSPIDRFVLSELESEDMQPADDVSKSARLRRVYLDVTGMPPRLEEQQAFLEDESPDAFERVVDDLLSRPTYGERWARHWLDLVRYADTNGYERDATKPSVWRYRDYVIDALNSDKPYDRFVMEQLAGDELPDADSESVIATGFFRLGPWDDEPADPLQDRSDQIDDMIRTTSEVFLATTLGCARCHNHKFDALAMLDYYRMYAVFDPLQRPQNGRQELDLPAGSETQLQALEQRNRQIAELQSAIATARQTFEQTFLGSEQCSLSESVRQAFMTPEKQRTAEQQAVVKQHRPALDEQVSAALPETVARTIAQSHSQIENLRRAVPDLPRAYFMTESKSHVPETFLQLRGRAALPGPRVDPGIPVVLTRHQPTFETQSSTTGRRLALAEWIADPRNPLTARVIVNRVWQFHFGEALVRTPSDFGILGDSPTHPELLDWLADWFVHDAKWSLKQLHRLILCSRTYQMDTVGHVEYAEHDPENWSLWKFPYRRLAVESIRDSMLAASGRLNRQMHGPGTYLFVPKEALDGHSDPDKIWKPFVESQASRRTVYAFVKRSLTVPMLEVLDLSDSTRSCEKRNVTSVSTQALTLFNGDFVNRQAAYLASRILDDRSLQTFDERLERAYRLTLCRDPRPGERQALRAFVQEEQGELGEQGELADQIDGGTVGQESRTSADREQWVWQQVCRVLFNLNEFAYPE